MVLIIIIGALYAHYGDLPALRRALTGVAAAAAGLMMATVAKMARPLVSQAALDAARSIAGRHLRRDRHHAMAAALVLAVHRAGEHRARMGAAMKAGRRHAVDARRLFRA